MFVVNCENCKYLKQRFENYFDWSFITSTNIGCKWSKRKWLMPYPLCMRKECFEIIDGRKIRFQGQAQLNKNHDCPHFKKIWWKFK